MHYQILKSVISDNKMMNNICLHKRIDLSERFCAKRFATLIKIKQNRSPMES